MEQHRVMLYDVPDVAELSLLTLLQLDDAALGPAIRRLRLEADRPEEVLSGWDAAV